MRRLLGALYGILAAARVGAYRRGLLPSHRLLGPVVSVGNLSVGGSGKTPVVARLAELLQRDGLPVSVLSRGYRGSFRGEALVVGDGTGLRASAAEAGDEPVMLARALPGVVVAIGPRRDVVGRAVEARFGPRVHLLDDGFQHLRLRRDLDLLCLDPADLDDRPLPAGRLRETAAAVARADLVLVTGDDLPAPRWAELRGALGPERTFRVARRLLGFFSRSGERRDAPERPFLFAGIARPERFARDVRATCPLTAGTRFFPDHHAFSAAELEDVASQARAAGASCLVTTAKDAERLGGADLGLPLLVFRVAALIEDEPRFLERLRPVIQRHPAFAPPEARTRGSS